MRVWWVVVLAAAVVAYLVLANVDSRSGRSSFTQIKMLNHFTPTQTDTLDQAGKEEKLRGNKNNNILKKKPRWLPVKTRGGLNVAIMFSGFARNTYPDKLLRNFENALPFFDQTIVKPLKDQGFNVSLFVHTWDLDGSRPAENSGGGGWFRDPNNISHAPLQEARYRAALAAMHADDVVIMIDNYTDVAAAWERDLKYREWYAYNQKNKDASAVKALLGMWYSVKAAFKLIPEDAFDVVIQLRPDYPWRMPDDQPIRFEVDPTPCVDGSHGKRVKVQLSGKWYSLTPRGCDQTPFDTPPQLCERHTNYILNRTNRSSLEAKFDDSTTSVLVACREYGLTETIALGTYDGMRRYTSLFDGIKRFTGLHMMPSWDWPFQAESYIVLNSFRAKFQIRYFSLVNWYEVTFCEAGAATRALCDTLFPFALEKKGRTTRSS